MSSSIPPRKAPTTPYHALHSDQMPASTGSQLDRTSRAVGSLPRPAQSPRRQSAAQAEYFAAETVKIEALKNALFTALETSPPAAIPPQLIDLAHTYSNLLKIQLTLMPDPAPSATSEPRPASADAPPTLDPTLVK